MNSQIAFSTVLLAFGAGLTLAGQGGAVVESVRFETSVTAPVYVVPKPLRHNEPLFRAGLENLPEVLLVVGALAVGSGDLTLSSKEAASLGPLVTEAYIKISSDAAFRATPSALPYCFAAKKHTTGHYFLYRPQKIPQSPTCIVFLHGYAGNFQFYMWVLKEAFPEAIILAPSWGVSWSEGSPTYLKDMLADARRRINVDLGKPWLMAISAGGHGGFSIYNRLPASFTGYVCLASLPGTSIVSRLRGDLKILMLNGTTDTMVPIALARKQVDLARQKLPTLSFKEIDGDHFFLLSKREETFRAIRQFMKEQRELPK